MHALLVGQEHFLTARAVDSGRGDGAVFFFFLFHGTVTAKSYLKEDSLSKRVKYHMQKEVFIFQQDGAPAHFAAKNPPLA